jgi:dTDP-4-dehydrorhamnose reductase
MLGFRMRTRAKGIFHAGGSDWVSRYDFARMIAKIFREEGYDISLSTVDRHRKESCGCYNMSVGK